MSDRVTAARINAAQAVAVATISALAGILTTLIATTPPPWSKATTAAAVVKSPASLESPASTADIVVDLVADNAALKRASHTGTMSGVVTPHMVYSIDSITGPTDVCQMRAARALQALGAANIVHNGPGSHGTLGQYRLSVGCYTVTHSVGVIVAGPEVVAARSLQRRLRYHFNGSVSPVPSKQR